MNAIRRFHLLAGSEEPMPSSCGYLARLKRAFRYRVASAIVDTWQTTTTRSMRL